TVITVSFRSNVTTSPSRLRTAFRSMSAVGQSRFVRSLHRESRQQSHPAHSECGEGQQTNPPPDANDGAVTQPARTMRRRITRACYSSLRPPPVSHRPLFAPLGGCAIAAQTQLK